MFITGPGSICTQQVWPLSVCPPPQDPGCHHVHAISKVKLRWVYFRLGTRMICFLATHAGADATRAAQSVLFHLVHPSLKGQTEQMVTRLTALTHKWETAPVFVCCRARKRLTPEPVKREPMQQSRWHLNESCDKPALLICGRSIEERSPNSDARSWQAGGGYGEERRGEGRGGLYLCWKALGWSRWREISVCRHGNRQCGLLQKHTPSLMRIQQLLAATPSRPHHLFTSPPHLKEHTEEQRRRLYK